MKKEKLIKHIKSMKKARSKYESLYSDIAYWFQPTIASFSLQGDSTMVGRNAGVHLVNKKGTQAGIRLANILFSSVIPVHEQFFTLAPAQDDGMSEFWKEATEKVSSALQGSNLSQIAIQALKSLCFFGSTGIFLGTDKNNDLVFQTYFPTDLYFDTDYNGNVDTFVTTKETTCRNLYQQFGEQVSSRVKERKENREELEITYNYITLEDGEWKQYILESDGTVLDEITFTSKPFVSPRVNKTSYEIYGRSFAIDALEDVKLLNEVETTNRRAVQKSVDPVIWIDYTPASIGADMTYNTNPGGIIETLSDGTGKAIPPQVLQLGGSIEAGEYQINKLEQSIDETFNLDVLNAIMNTERGQRTATEVNGIISEKLDLIVPIVIELIDEFVKPVIERTFQILVDTKQIELPEGIEDGHSFDVDVYSSLIIKMRQLRSRTTLEVINTIAGISQLDPAVLDLIDLDKALLDYIKQSNVPSSVIRSGDVLTEYRKARQQAQMQSQEQEQLMSKIGAVDPSKTIEEGSPLSKMM